MCLSSLALPYAWLLVAQGILEISCELSPAFFSISFIEKDLQPTMVEPLDWN